MYDVAIIGSGPAGLTASIYASCFHLTHIVIGKEMGGQMAWAPDILNYPGFSEITGKDLTQRMVDHAKSRGADIVKDSVIGINKIDQGEGQEPIYEILTERSTKFQAKSIILATGTERRKLNIPGEVEYTGRGVHYCPTCDKQDYEGKVTSVVGGANSAVQAAVELAQAASKVIIVYRGNQLCGDQIWIEQIKNNAKIEVRYGIKPIEIIGNGQTVTALKVEHATQPGVDLQEIPVDKVFVEIGGVPGTSLLIPLGLQVDAGGYITVNEELGTNVPGIYAAGDLVSYGLSIEQISSAVGLGARAASSVFAYLKKDKPPVLWGANQIPK